MKMDKENNRSKDLETRIDKSSISKQILLICAAGNRIFDELMNIEEYGVIYAENLEDAKKEIDVMNVDLIIADSMEGAELLQAMGESHPPIAFYSDKKQPSGKDIEAAWESGAAGYLKKSDDLVEKLEAIFKKEDDRKLEIEWYKIAPRLTSRTEVFSPEDYAIIAYIVRERKFKGKLLESQESTDQYTEGPAMLRDLDRTKQYEDNVRFYVLEHAHGKGYSKKIAIRKQRFYEQFQGDENFKVSDVLPRTIDKERNVGYIRREFIIGPTLAEGFTAINNGIDELDTLLENATGDKQKQKLVDKLRKAESLKHILMRKALRDLAYWQEKCAPRETSENKSKSLRSRYIRNLKKAVKDFSSLTDIEISKEEQRVFGYCLPVFAERMEIDQYTFTRKLDATPWNVTLKTGKMDMDLDELLEYFENEKKTNIDAKKVDDVFYHYDLGSDYDAHSYSCVLEDFWHMADAFEANLTGGQIRAMYYIFLLEKVKEGHRGKRKGLFDTLFSGTGKDIDRLIANIEKGEIDKEKILKHAGNFDKNNEEERVYRNARKASLMLEVYEHNNYSKHKRGLRGDKKYQERGDYHKRFIEHHARKTTAYRQRIESLQEQFEQEIEEMGVENELKVLNLNSRYQELSRLEAKVSSFGLNKESAVEYKNYFTLVNKQAEEGDEDLQKAFGDLIELAKLKYIQAMFEKLAQFNQSTSMNYESEN